MKLSQLPIVVYLSTRVIQYVYFRRFERWFIATLFLFVQNKQSMVVISYKLENPMTGDNHRYL